MEIPVRLFRKWRFFRFLTSIIFLVKLGVNEQADIYHCHEGDSSLLAGVIVKGILNLRGKNVQLIYDSHEALAYTFYDRANRLLKTPVKWVVFLYEYWLSKFSDAIITANDVVKSYFQMLHPTTPVIRLYNVPKLSLLDDPAESNELKEYQFCHEGGIALKRGIKPLFESFIELATHRDDWKFLFIGGPMNAQAEAYIDKMFDRYPALSHHVKITGWLPYEQVGTYLQKCQVGCIFFEPTMNNMLGGPPNKLFNYMRYGMPVIAPAYPEIQKIIKDANCGILLEQINKKTILSLMRQILEGKVALTELGNQGMVACLDRYHWDSESEKLKKLYKDLI